ncbi:10148_t:CDS:1, partial [Racocetra fulgida]
NLNHNNLNLQTSRTLYSNELSNSSDINNQRFEPNYNKISGDEQSYHGNIDLEYNDQHMSSGSLCDTDNLECDQKFEDNLDYDDLESIYYENEFNNNINSDSLNDECELISMDDNAPKTFNGTKSNINWNHECPF